MQNGWIKLYRKLKDKGFYKKPYYLALWVHLLLSANHQESEFMWNGKLIKVKEGQFITGRKELSLQTGIPETTIERILGTLENGHQIGQQKTTKYRLISILKWKSYQSSDNKRTTNGHKQEGKEYKEIAKTSFALKVKEKDMKKNSFNYKETNHEDSYEESIDYDTGEKSASKKENTAKYPNSRTVFALFGKYPLNWKINKTQLQAAENLFLERGVEQIMKAINFVKQNKDKEFCPVINSPYDLDSKWAKIISFKKKQ